MKNKQNLGFFVSTLLLGIYFIFRLVNQSKILTIFPLDRNNDWIAHMGFIFFLKNFGYHNLVPMWDGGFYLFNLYAPSYHFFFFPLYLLTNNIQTTIFVSLILMFIIIFISIWYIGKAYNFSALQRAFFFFILFANPISIGNFIRLGRVAELFAWMIFLLSFTLLAFYRQKNFDLKFSLLFIPIYSVLLISYPGITILLNLVLLSFLLSKPLSDWIKIILLSLISLLITSNWWLTFILASFKAKLIGENMTLRLLEFGGPWFLTNIASILIAIALVISFFLFWNLNPDKRRELLFFLPTLVLLLLFLTRAIVFVPILNKIFPDIYIIYFLFFTVFYFIRANYEKTKFTSLILLLLILAVIIMIIMSVVHTSFFVDNTALDNEVKETLDGVNNKYIIMNQFYSLASTTPYYSYGTIFLNKTTASGANSLGVRTPEYDQKVEDLGISFKSGDCNNFMRVSEDLGIKDFIGFEQQCEQLKSCGLKLKKQTERVCLYKINFNN